MSDTALMRNTAELERAALAYVLQHPRVLHDVDLLPEHFRNPCHAKILQAIAILSLRDGADGIDLAVLHAELVRVGAGVTVTDLLDLFELETFRIEEIVRELERARVRYQAHLAAVTLQAALNDPATDELEAIGEAVSSLLDVRRGTASERYNYADAMTARAHRVLRGERARRVPSGFAVLDDVLVGGGFKRGALTLVAGRTGWGKSSFLQQCAEATGTRGRALLASPEMLADDVTLRALARQLGIDLWDLEEGRLTPEQRARLERFRPSAVGLTLYTARPQSVAQIAAEARVLALGGPLDLLAIDYVQFLHARRAKGETRDEQLGRVVHELLDLAAELDVAVVAGAQLNRRADEDGEKPQLRHLRESGNLEMDADTVLLLHGPEAGCVEINVAKQRNGPTGIVRLRWSPSLTRFSDDGA